MNQSNFLKIAKKDGIKQIMKMNITGKPNGLTFTGAIRKIRITSFLPSVIIINLIIMYSHIQWGIFSLLNKIMRWLDNNNNLNLNMDKI